MTARQAIELVTNNPGRTATELAVFAQVKPNTLASQLSALAWDKKLQRLNEPDVREMRNPSRFALKRFSGARISKAWRYYPIGEQPVLPTNPLPDHSQLL